MKMRVLAACFVGFLSLGALATMAACSDSTDAAQAGAGGGSAAGSGSGGKAGSAGGTSTAGTGSGVTCGFLSDECTACLTETCEDQTTACAMDSSCGADLGALSICVCDPNKDPDTCIGKFVTDNGDLGTQLAQCYTLNCEDLCK